MVESAKAWSELGSFLGIWETWLCELIPVAWLSGPFRGVLGRPSMAARLICVNSSIAFNFWM